MDLTAKRVRIVALHQERIRLENQLMQPEEMLGGPLAELSIPCGKPNCHCKRKGAKGHGPYHYVQVKIKGKYTNVYLGKNKELIKLARCYSEYIRRLARLRQINKEIDKILEKMNRSKIQKVRFQR